MKLHGEISRRELWLVAGAVLAACETPEPDVARVPLAPGVSMLLPRPGELGRMVEAAQMIEISHGEQKFALEGRLSISPQRLLLVATDALGRRALTTSWNGTTLDAELAPWMPGALRAANVIGDIVILFWPDEVLARVLAPAKATLASGTDGRVIAAGGRDIVRVQYRPNRSAAWNGTAVCTNLAWGYRLSIRTAELAA